MVQQPLLEDSIGGLAAGVLTYTTAEALTIELNQLTGVDPVLTKPITKQSEVPATPFATLQAAFNALPQIIAHTVNFNMRSHQRWTSGYYVLACPGRLFAGVPYTDYVAINGERDVAVTATVVSMTDRWHFNFEAGSFTPGALVGKMFLVTSGTGAGQRGIVKDNGSNWLELVARAGSAYTSSSVLEIYSPKWRITGSTNDLTTGTVRGIYAAAPIGFPELRIYDVQFDWLPLGGIYAMGVANSINPYSCVFDSSHNTSMARPVATSYNGGQISMQVCVVKSHIITAYTNNWVFLSCGAQASLSVLFCWMNNVNCSYVYDKGKIIFQDNWFSGIASVTGRPYFFRVATGGYCWMSSSGYGRQLTATPTIGGNFVDLGSLAIPLFVVDGQSSLELDYSEYNNCASTLFDIGGSSVLAVTWPTDPVAGTGNTQAWKISGGARVSIPLAWEPTAGIALTVDGVALQYADIDTYTPFTGPGGSVVSRYGATPSGLGFSQSGIANFANSSSQAVTFPLAMPDATYAVHLTPSEDTGVHYTSRTTAGFTIVTSAPITGEVSWQVKNV